MTEPKLAVHPAYRTGRRLGLENKPCEVPASIAGFITDKHAALFSAGYVDGCIERCRWHWSIRYGIEAPHAN